MDGLDALGFQIVDDSESTNWRTELTLLGMMSSETTMTEQDVVPLLEHQNRRESRRLLRHSPAPIALRSAGYELVTLASPNERLTLDAWDRVIDGGHLGQFEIGVLLDSTVGPWLHGVVAADLRARVAGQFSALVDLADPTAQRVVFAHLMTPHPPFLWDANGRPLDLMPCVAPPCSVFRADAGAIGPTLEEHERLAVAQTEYVDRQLLETLGEVVARDPYAVVAVVSDHGTRHADRVTPEFYRNLMAVRLPAGDYGAGFRTTRDMMLRLAEAAARA